MSPRARIILGGLAAVYVLVVLRAFHIQILGVREIQERGAKQYCATIPLVPQRGAILDRDLSKVHEVNPHDPDGVREFIDHSWYDYSGTPGRGRGGAGFPAGMKWGFLAKREGVFPSLVIREEIPAMLPPAFKGVEVHHGMLTPEADAVHGVHFRDQSFRWLHRMIVCPSCGARFRDRLHGTRFCGKEVEAVNASTYEISTPEIVCGI